MLKKLIKVMGLVTKGKVTTGEKAKELNKAQEIKSPPKPTPPTPQNNTSLKTEEFQFIISKMRQADYKGTELEMSFIIFSKLSALLK